MALIQDGDKSAYRLKAEQLTVWCSQNNLELKTLKTGCCGALYHYMLEIYKAHMLR